MDSPTVSFVRYAIAGFAILVGGALHWVACHGGDEPSSDVSAPPLYDSGDAGDGSVVADHDTSSDVGSDQDAHHDTEPAEATTPDGAAAYPWLFDPDVWNPNQDVDGCNVFESAPEKVVWPGHNWSDCGTGCRVAEALDGPARSYFFGYGTSAREVDGRLIMSAAIRVELGPPVTLLARYALDNPTPMSLVKAQWTDTVRCGATFASPSAGRVFRVVPYESANITVGIMPEQPGLPLWPEPSFLDGMWHAFEWGSGWGGIFNNSSIRVAHSWTSTDMETVANVAYGETARGFGDSVFWNDWELPRATLWRWNASAGTAVRLIQGAFDVADFALTSEFIAWLGVQGTQASSGSYDSGRLYWTSYTTDPTAVVVHEGPNLPVHAKFGSMHASDKWLVVPACETYESCVMLVIRFADQKVWSIPGRAGEGVFETPIAITDSELIMVESVTTAQGGPENGYLRLLRYELSLIEAYGTALE